MRTPRRAVATALVALVPLSACTPGTGPAPTASGPTPSATASATPSPEPTLDLTRPGAARAIVGDLLAASGATRALMVTVTERDAAVAVARDGAAQTWAYRDGRVQQVQSDINFVAQSTFSPADFALDDVGALFRAARAVSGADSRQTLQIVDYSGGSVAMTVSTNPESRTVFFNPDGTLLPTLDFTSPGGLQQGYADAVGARGVALALGFGSQAGVYLDTPGDQPGTVARRQRSARTPVIVTVRTEQTAGAAFNPALVRPDVVWGVLQRLASEGSFALDQAWTCVADDRAGTGTPRLHFQVGQRAFTADLAGSVLTP